MIHELSCNWANKLVKYGASAENEEVIAYGIECLLNEIIVDIIIFIFAFIIGRPLEMLVWNVFLLPMRYSIGGHHMSSHIKCIVSSTLWAAVCILIYPYLLGIPWLIPIEIALTLIIAFRFAPFVHPNHPMSDSHKAKLKRNGKIIAVIESAVIVVFCFFLPDWVAQVSALGMFSATVLCIMGFIGLRKKGTRA